MKNVYKRINRGLVLAGVLLVGFVIYVISDTLQFKKTKPLLKDMAADYMQHCTTQSKDMITWAVLTPHLVTEQSALFTVAVILVIYPYTSPESFR